MVYVAGDLGHIAVHNAAAAVLAAQYTSYTPTPTQSSATTWSFNAGGYEIIAKRITGEHLVIFTGGGTINNSVTTVVPFAPRWSATASTCVGSFQFYDSSANTTYNGSVIATATAFLFRRDSQTNYLGTAPSLAVATGDQLSYNYTYNLA